MNNIVRDNGFDVDVLYAAGGGISAGLWGMWGTEYVIIHDNTIVSNSIMGNSECDGGGIAFFRNGRITDNIINENSLTSDVNWGSGGGIAVGSLSENPNIVVDGNQIISNKITGIDGAYGGGIIIGYCDVPITNNIISGNIASLGGGICLNTSNSEIINNTIVNNTASYQGGGLYSTDSNPVVVNTIFWDNEATNGSQIYGSGDVLYSDIQGGWSGEGNIDFDPFFADTLFNLSETSPCVGNGKDSIKISNIWYRCPVSDYFNNPRPNPVDGYVDMGAIESDFPSDISDYFSNYPTNFNLYQNYPNPFNPITNIEYRIANSEFVTLKIYNLLGQEMVTLVSKKLNQGNHTYQFDGKNLASGIYYYQLVAGDYREVKKMILLR